MSNNFQPGFNAAGSAVSNSANLKAEGITTLVWGSEGLFPGYAYIVTSASETARVDQNLVENSSGFQVLIVLLNQGYNIEITVVDDTNIPAPTVGTVVSLVLPINISVAQTAPSSITCLIVDVKADQARKREGMRSFTLMSFTAFTPT